MITGDKTQISFMIASLSIILVIFLADASISSETILKLNKKNIELYKNLALPKENEEDWRYTDVERLKLENFEPFESNGRISAALSEDLAEKGVILTDVNTALEKYQIARDYYFRNAKIGKDKFVALNAAYFDNGIFLYVPKNIEIGEPIKINFNFDGKCSILHNIIVVESNSKLDFIEEYSNKELEEEQLNECITEVFANQDSKINFYHLQLLQLFFCRCAAHQAQPS